MLEQKQQTDGPIYSLINVFSRWHVQIPSTLRASNNHNGYISDLIGRLPLFLIAHLTLILTALVLRIWDLGSRAMHHDESLHALYSWNLAVGKGYSHDPMMHGPFQIEITAAIFYIFGDGELTARLLYAVAGALLVGLPFFLRHRLGHKGALIVAVLLTFSPTMLYFSRFARNDIIMAVWTFILVIVMWRYIDDGKSRNVYIAAAVLSLAFCTKETAYLITGILVIYLSLRLISINWGLIKKDVVIGEVSPPIAITRIIKGAWSILPLDRRLRTVSKPAGFLVLVITLTAPLGSAFISMFQDTPVLGWSNLILSSPMEGPGPIGSPVGGGIVIAFLIVASILAVSVFIGFNWQNWMWIRCLAIFYVIWILAYTTLGYNWSGIASGVWRSLGYWVVQQGEGRGDQPTYYYMLLTPLYEFLPLILALGAGIYYLKRSDAFGSFLVFWTISTFIIYTIASEKMPWLMVNISLPMIILGGKFLGEVLDHIDWRKLVTGGGLFILVGVPIVTILLYALIFVDVSISEPGSLLWLSVLLITLVGVSLSGYVIAKNVGHKNFLAFSILSISVVLFILTVRTSFKASYENSDIPVEMLVYTQTSPHISGLYKHIENSKLNSNQLEPLPLSVDNTSGFSWPWAWYFRNTTKYKVSYDTFARPDLPYYASSSSILIVHRNNKQNSDPKITDAFGNGQLIRHRWWFPEYKYRDLTPGKLFRVSLDIDVWRSVIEYFLYREHVFEEIGSEDSYVFFRHGFPNDFTASP